MIRRAEPGELIYVASSWYGGIIRGERATVTKRERVGAMIARLLITEPVIVEIQIRDDRPTVRGWCCYTPMGTTAALHYVYVRHEYREEGIARALVWAAGVDRARTVLHTHENALARAVIKRTGVRARRIEVIGGP